MATHISTSGTRVNCQATQRRCPRGSHLSDILLDLDSNDSEDKRIIETVETFTRLYRRGNKEVSDQEIANFIDKHYSLDENRRLKLITTDYDKYPSYNDDGVSLTEDYEGFKALYQTARSQVRNNINPLDQYSTFLLPEEERPENIFVEHPYGLPWIVGREIEVVYGSDNGEEELKSLGSWLYKKGLTEDPEIQKYHSGRYGTDIDSWRFEEDESVEAEIITPPLKYTPKQVSTALEVNNKIKELGFKVDRSCGGHIHVNTDEMTIEDLGRLGLIHTRFEDTLYRLFSAPERTLTTLGQPVLEADELRPMPRVTHRGTRYAEPLRGEDFKASEGYVKKKATGSVTETLKNIAREYDRSSFRISHPMIKISNFETVGPHMEYRVPDGSLEPSVQEAHMKLAVAITAAAMNPENTEKLLSLPPSPHGSHAQFRGNQKWFRFWGRGRRDGRERETSAKNLTAAEWEADTKNFRELVDILFTSQKDKEQMTALFAMTNWN